MASSMDDPAARISKLEAFTSDVASIRPLMGEARGRKSAHRSGFIAPKSLRLQSRGVIRDYKSEGSEEQTPIRSQSASRFERRRSLRPSRTVSPSQTPSAQSLRWAWVGV